MKQEPKNTRLFLKIVLIKSQCVRQNRGKVKIWEEGKGDD